MAVEVRKDAIITKQLDEEIKKNIQQVIFQNFPFSLDANNIQIVESGSLPKTTSGKVRRFEVKTNFENGSFKLAVNQKNTFGLKLALDFLRRLLAYMSFLFTLLVSFFQSKSPSKRREGEMSKISKKSLKTTPNSKPHATHVQLDKQKRTPKISKTEKEIQEFLIPILCKLLNVDNLELDAALYQYGLKSVDAVEVCGELERFIGEKINPTCFYENYTIEMLSDYLVYGSRTTPSIPLEEFKPLMVNDGVALGRPSRAFILGIATAVPEYNLQQINSIGTLLELSNTLSSR